MSSIFCLSLVWSNLFLIENFTFFFLSLRKIAEVVKFCKPRVPPSLSQGYMLLSGKVRNSSNFSSSLFASALPAPQRSNWPCFSELGCVVTSYPCWSVSSLGCCFSQDVMHEVAQLKIETTYKQISKESYLRFCIGKVGCYFLWVW